jgi:methionyl-tRNA formyltransferase
VRLAGQGIVIACGEGAVRVLELQRAGGRPLAAGAFVAGSGIRPGMNVGR